MLHPDLLSSLLQSLCSPPAPCPLNLLMKGLSVAFLGRTFPGLLAVFQALAEDWQSMDISITPAQIVPATDRHQIVAAWLPCFQEVAFFFQSFVAVLRGTSLEIELLGFFYGSISLICSCTGILFSGSASRDHNLGQSLFVAHPTSESYIVVHPHSTGRSGKGWVRDG